MNSHALTDGRSLADRISTGNVQADEILHGGFLQNSINIIMGQPGTGKTVFVEQMMFHHAVGDRPVLYLTTLSEPQARMLTYAQRFSFYEQDKIGQNILFEDVGERLATEGIRALPLVIKEAIRTTAPKMILIDSFKAMHDLAASPLEMRRMLYELTGIITAYQTTVFLVGEYADEDARRLPEFAIVDGIMQLLRDPRSTRDERFIRVLKLRGSGYMEGLHGFKIKPAGLEVYPRLVTPDIPETYKVHNQRLSTGIKGLDQVLNGGLWRGSTTLLAGPSGSGKTTMALQFAFEGVRKGEPTLYVHFQENPVTLARAIQTLGVDLEHLAANGFNRIYASPVELQIDAVIVKMFKVIQEKKIRRLVIDSVGDLMAAASDGERLQNYLYSMIQHLNSRDVASILIWETVGEFTSRPGDTGDRGRFSFMSDNIVVLWIDLKSKSKRSMAVIKARGTPHDLDVHEFEITAKGARIVDHRS